MDTIQEQVSPKSEHNVDQFDFKMNNNGVLAKNTQKPMITQEEEN